MTGDVASVVNAFGRSRIEERSAVARSRVAMRSTRRPRSVGAWRMPKTVRGRIFQSLSMAMVVWSTLLSGCATFEAEKGVAARRVPKELLAKPRANKELIDLAMLRQDPPDVYRLGPNDILGVYIEGVTGPADQPPPVFKPTELPNIQRGQSRRSLPSIGYPIPVNEDGTVSLPLVEPVKVEGLTVREAEDAIRKAYTVDRKILRPGNDRIIVTLQEKRTYQVLVIREDAELPAARTQRVSEIAISTQRGRGFAIDLVAYENDVLHALTETGGLPGIDAVDEVVVLRSRFADAKRRSELIAQIQAANADVCAIPPSIVGEKGVLRIPLRYAPGESPTITKEDIVLNDGDIVFVDSRETDVFYTGGILNGNQIPLPRDYDLDVLEAVALAGGPVGGGGVNFRAGNVGAGIGVFGALQGGAIPPSRCVIVREMPPNGQFAIQVDLKRALKDPQERVLIQAGDLLVVTYTPAESVANLILSTFPFNIGWQILAFN